MNGYAQRVYVVRVWREPSSGPVGVWRASATDSTGGERRFFATPEALAGFLKRDLAPPPPDGLRWAAGQIETEQLDGPSAPQSRGEETR